MGTDKQAERVLKAFNGLPSSPPTHDDPTNQEKTRVQVAFHLGHGICGHKGIV